MLQMIFMLTSILTMKLLSVLDSEFNLSLKEMAFAPEGITNVCIRINVEKIIFHRRLQDYPGQLDFFYQNLPVN